jgi:hypothetical protein
MNQNSIFSPLISSLILCSNSFAGITFGGLTFDNTNSGTPVGQWNVQSISPSDTGMEMFVLMISLYFYDFNTKSL